MNKDIAVIGCRPFLPDSFPIDMPENSGNMIHATVPMILYKNAYHNLTVSKEHLNGESFVDYVNSRCSHLIVTLANTIRLDKQVPENYKKFHNSLKRYKVPIIVFGFGIQAKEGLENEHELCKEAIELIEFLSSRAELLGVRGKLTKKIIEKNTNVNNIYVTGCPSLFSNPAGLLSLKLNWQKKLIEENKKGVVNVTNLQRYSETEFLIKGIEGNLHLIEPVSKITHQYHLDLKEKYKDIDYPPYYLKKYCKDNKSRLNTVKNFYLNNYSIFRDIDSWYEFNMKNVRFTIGTRFHVNMASILSGVPALWLIHDARTLELAEYFKLPNIHLDNVENYTIEELIRLIDYNPFFENLSRVFERFNHYLEMNKLPTLKNYYV